MPQMHAVEIADRHGPFAELVGQCGQIADQFHSSRQSGKDGVRRVAHYQRPAKTGQPAG